MLQNGNGFIAAEEFRLAMTKLKRNITDEDINEMMKNADLDGDGQLNYKGKLFIKGPQCSVFHSRL